MKKTNIDLEPLSYATREEIKTLRTNITFCGNDKQIIMVTSSFMGEGKTKVSARLAVSLAELNKKVLLLDVDLRKSVLVSRLNAKNVNRGMTHYLSGQCPLSEVVMSTNIPKLHIIFAGPVAPNPTELLSGDRFQKMLDYLRTLYDYIILDAPPLGMVVDGAIIANHSDGALMVMESGAIKYRMAQDVKKKIESAGCPLLGVVLNKIDHKKTGGYYNKYYGKKYKKYGKYYGKENSEEYDFDEYSQEELGEEISKDLKKREQNKVCGAVLSELHRIFWLLIFDLLYS